LTKTPAAVKEKCPWFFKLKAIIDERPNAVPVGVGNNSSGYDASILASSRNTSEFDWSDPGLYTIDGDHGDGDNNDLADGDGGNSDDEHGDINSEGSDDEGGDSVIISEITIQPSKTPASLKTSTATKRKATAIVEAPETKPLLEKTSARAGKSTPAATTASQRASKNPKTGIEKINAIAVKEEETTQKVLDLKKLKVKGENDKVLAKIKAKAEVRMQQMKLRAELAQKKLDNEFRLQMARMGHASSEAGSSSIVRNAPHSGYSDAGSVWMRHASSEAGPSSMPVVRNAPCSGYSDAGSVTPSTYSSEMPLLDPSLEFLGQNSGYDFDHFND
jgi:hypothetical protein